MLSEKLSPRDSIFIGILALALGAVLVFFLFQPHIMDRNVIKIDVAEEGAKVVSFNDFAILPGEQTEYSIVFDEVDVSPYDVALKFQTENDYSSYDFIYVRIIVDGKVLRDKSLNDMFAEETVFLHIKPIQNKKVEAQIVYYIPVDVGNEAQNIAVDFDLIVTATTQQPIEEVVK